MNIMNAPVKKERLTSFEIITSVIVLLWIILAVNFFLPINSYGIIPRDINGLKGVIFSPFLHANMYHLIANSITLFFLGLIFITLERRRAIMITLYLIICGGLGTWIIGRSGAVHIGSSGVIYGIMGYLFFIGIFSRNIKTILVSLVTFFFYGGAIWGILPVNSFVSWESHLCGLFSGMFVPRINKKKTDRTAAD